MTVDDGPIGETQEDPAAQVVFRKIIEHVAAIISVAGSFVRRAVLEAMRAALTSCPADIFDGIGD